MCTLYELVLICRLIICYILFHPFLASSRRKLHALCVSRHCRIATPTFAHLGHRTMASTALEIPWKSHIGKEQREICAGRADVSQTALCRAPHSCAVHRRT